MKDVDKFNQRQSMHNASLIVDLDTLSRLGIENFFEKNLDDSEDNLSHHTPWVFHFTDIIYVATIYNIGRHSLWYHHRM